MEVLQSVTEEDGCRSFLLAGGPLGADNWLPGEPNNLRNEDGAAI